MKFLSKNYIAISGLLGAFTVALGAIGAHKLQDLISEKHLSYFEKGVFYQFIHVGLLLAVGILYSKHQTKSLERAGFFSLLGILMFSGSLYILSLQELIELGKAKSLMIPLTPIGGVCFIISWSYLGQFGWKLSSKKEK